MDSTRPRRATPASLTVRVARLAIPGLLVGLATTGVVAAGTGSPSAGPVPAVTTAAADLGTDARSGPVSRGETDARPALDAAAAAKVAKVAKA